MIPDISLYNTACLNWPKLTTRDQRSTVKPSWTGLCVKTDKDSGIVNDANEWAAETMGNPKYPLELFLRVITVSLETMKIVKSLPKLEFP